MRLVEGPLDVEASKFIFSIKKPKSFLKLAFSSLLGSYLPAMRSFFSSDDAPWFLSTM